MHAARIIGIHHRTVRIIPRLDALHAAVEPQHVYQLLLPGVGQPVADAGRLSSGRGAASIEACPFTNFIAISARRIAKSWCGPAVGRGASARTADQRSSRRSSRSLPRPAAAMRARLPRARAAGADAAAEADAAGTGIDVRSGDRRLRSVHMLDFPGTRTFLSRLIAA